MRPALVSLMAAAAFIGGAAQAQPNTPATPATPASPPPTATTPAPANPATPAPTAPAPAPANPAAGTPPAPVAPSATPAAPATPAPPPAPAAPTDPLTVAVLGALNQICVPAVNGGGTLDQLARGAGYRRNRDNYVLRQQTFQITVNALQSGGRTCEAVFEYEAAPIPQVITAVHEWALARGMTLRDPFRSSTDIQRDVRSWERDQDALALVSEKRLDGSPVAGRRDRSRFLYQRRNPAS
jgi:hypothetical protein